MSISNIPPAATTPIPMPRAIAAVLALRSSSCTSSLVSATSCTSKSLASLMMPHTLDRFAGFARGRPAQFLGFGRHSGNSPRCILYPTTVGAAHFVAILCHAPLHFLLGLLAGIAVSLLYQTDQFVRLPPDAVEV